jgi:hypothetical protein
MNIIKNLGFKVLVLCLLVSILSGSPYVVPSTENGYTSTVNADAGSITRTHSVYYNDFSEIISSYPLAVIQDGILYSGTMYLMNVNQYGSGFVAYYSGNLHFVRVVDKY